MVEPWRPAWAGRVPDQRVRQAILAHLEENPGANIAALSAALERSRGTITHHVRRLERAGAVVSVRNGRELRLMLTTQHKAHGARGTVFSAQHRALAACVADEPGAMQKVIAERLGASRKALRRCIDELLQNGLLMEVRDGRARRYPPTSRLLRWLDPRGGDADGY